MDISELINLGNPGLLENPPLYNFNKPTYAQYKAHPSLNIASSSAVISLSLLDPTLLVILYDPNQPIDPFLWDGDFGVISIFSTKEFFAQDISNIVCSLQQATTYIR